jgi:hypothetical protein
MVTVKCAFCEKDKWVRQLRKSKSGNYYCNASCQMKYEYKNNVRDKVKIVEAAHNRVREKSLERFKTNPNIMRSKRGYLQIYIPQVGWKNMHHYVWEDLHKRARPKGMHIHHIDNDRDNNDISNLQMVTPSEHAKIHDNDKCSKTGRFRNSV